MADNPILDDVKSFLDDIVSDLTGMHVKAAQYQNAPYDNDAVQALAQLPAGLIDRAQDLRARLETADEDAKPKAAAKTKAAAARR